MKKTVFSIILVSIVYLAIELVAYAAYRIKFGEYSLYKIQHSKLAVLKQPENGGVFIPAEARQQDVTVKPILHPFIGYTVDGKKKLPECIATAEKSCVERIKVATDFPLQKRSDDKLIVAIVGGSFADGTARGGTPDIIQQELSRLPIFAGKEITLYNMAGGGYKQPQQLMHVSYYYALGAEFDIIINLDGFNEMATTYYGWRDSQLHPAFPVSWNHRVASGIDQGLLDEYAKKKRDAETHAKIAEFCLLEGVRYSPLMNFIWRIMDGRLRHPSTLISAPGDQQTKSVHRDFQYEALGPDHAINDFEALTDYTTELWANSSLALQALADGRGAHYFHFIQPNQYIPGSKVLSDFEREHAIIANAGYGAVYKKAYPKLSARAQKLAEQGVAIIDLTHMFAETADTLYIDNCCHLNPKGYDMVARELVRHIGLVLQEEL